MPISRSVSGAVPGSSLYLPVSKRDCAQSDIGLGTALPSGGMFRMPVALAPAQPLPRTVSGQAIAIYIFVVGMINNVIGPFSVGFLNDYLQGSNGR